MNLSGLFIIDSVFLGVGLAVDAFSVSVVNGLSEPGLHPLKAAKIASVFAFFQALMPMLGWSLTRLMLQHFVRLQKMVPYVSLLLLCYLGSKLILESVHARHSCFSQSALSGRDLLLQGIATSLDALSVGFAIAEYPFAQALPCSLIIAAVTFLICALGVMIGKRIGCRIAEKAKLLGGIVLVAIGIEIFLQNT